MLRRIVPLVAGPLLLTACGFDPPAMPGGAPATNSGTQNIQAVQGIGIPSSANAVMTVSSTVGASTATAKSFQAAAAISGRVQIDSATIVLQQVSFEMDDEGNGSDSTAGNDTAGSDPNGAPADSGGANDVKTGSAQKDNNSPQSDGSADPQMDPNEGDPSADDGDKENEGDPEDDHLLLEGPFVVDLINETVVNHGTTFINDDADRDGTPDIEDDDDDGDGVPDQLDTDDDNDGIPDQDDHTLGDSSLLDAVTLSPGQYSRIKFQMNPLDAAVAPGDPMTGFSILVSGSIDGVPFRYCGRYTEDFKVQSLTSIAVTDGSVASFLLDFDPVSWFDGVDPAAGELTADGMLEMCDDSNAALGQIVHDNIHQLVKLAEDDDGDGVDDSEQTPENAGASGDSGSSGGAGSADGAGAAADPETAGAGQG